MPIYVVIATANPLDSEVENGFDDRARCRAAPGVWFVKSPRLSSQEVSDDLGIQVDVKSGIVVTAKHYAGVAGRDLVEKLSVWESER